MRIHLHVYTDKIYINVTLHIDEFSYKYKYLDLSE